jgi:uncharacterized protein YgiM (DUF1202 family)
LYSNSSHIENDFKNSQAFMRKLLAIIFILTAFAASAQYVTVKDEYVAAKTGLSIREKPEAGAAVLEKIPYGTKIKTTYNYDELKTVVVEEMEGYWVKTTYKGKTGYVVSSYLLPVAAPGATVKTMKDYLAQLSAVAAPALTVKNGTTQEIGEGGYILKKQFYKNGAEHHDITWYEANEDVYFLPGLSLQQGFVLVRLIPEFKTVFAATDVFPTENKTRKLKPEGGDYKITVTKTEETKTISKITVEFSEGAYYTFYMFEMAGQLVISFGGGV